MKTFKWIDLSGQLILTLIAIVSLCIQNFNWMLVSLMIIGAWHILSNIISLALYNRSYVHYRKHLFFFCSSTGYFVAGLLFLLVGLGQITMILAFLSMFVAVFWYIFYVSLTISDLQHIHRLEQQRHLVDIGH